MKNPFIDKIRQIILDHLDDEKFGVSKLASEIGLSKTQTYRKVKAISNKSISQFIREIRLQEAAKLILNSNLNASEISYKVGFSSPSYFNKCFSTYYGITPGVYKENPLVKPLDQPNSRSSIKKLQTVFYILGASLLFFVSISIVKNIINPPKISIAVLIFDDHSPNSDMEWFCSGVTEEIITKLSTIEILEVRSFQSVKQFKGSHKSIPEIVKTLGVDYIIEGSGFKHNDSIRLTAQLINTKDKHSWSINYDESLDNSVKILSSFSKLIVQKLQIDLTNEEEKRIDYTPTDNPEAFQLLSEGKSFADLRTPHGLIKSVGLFQKAIDADPNYAEAYAEKAASYLIMFFYHIEGNTVSHENKISYENVNWLIDKALEINPNTVRAYTTRGMIYTYHKNNWKKVKKYYDKALEINPNDAIAHYYYALYYSQKPEENYKKALEEVNIAQKLNPHIKSLNLNKIFYLLYNDKIKEAEEFYRSNYSFFSKDAKLRMQLAFIAYNAKINSIEKKDWNEAIKIYLDAINKYPENIELNNRLAKAYLEILYDIPNYLKYAEKAYRLDSLNRRNAYSYYNSLLLNKKFPEAKKILQNENLKLLFLGNGEFKISFYLYYYLGEYKKANKPLNKYKYEFYFEHSLNFAQQNKYKEAYEIINKGVLKHFEKAVVFAILEEKDSMYHYLDKENNIYNILKFNGFKEVDPYRKEDRYKTLLKKHYLPLTHWNE